MMAVMGIMAGVATPNLQAMMNRMKLEQAVVEIRSALEETQRKAVRDNKLCDITLDTIEGEVSGDCLVTGNRSIPQSIDVVTNLINSDGTGSSDEAIDDSDEIETTSTLTDSYLGVITSSNNEPPQIALAPIAQKDAKQSKAGMAIHIISKKDKSKEKEKCTEKKAAQGKCVLVKFGNLGNAEFNIDTNTTNGKPVDPTGKIVLFMPGHPSLERRCVAISNTLGLTRMGNYTGTLEPADITDSGVCTSMDWEGTVNQTASFILSFWGQSLRVQAAIVP